MKRLTKSAAAAAAALLALPATALAGQTITMTPQLSGTLGGNGSLSIQMTNASTTGGLPSPLDGPFYADLPAGLTYNVADFPTCSPALIEAAVGTAPACPAGSEIGSGVARIGADLGGTALNEPAVLDAFLTARSPASVAFWGNGTSPVAETLVFMGSLTATAPPFGDKLAINIPLIPTVAGGPDASLLSVQLTFAATAKVTTSETVHQGSKKVKKRVTKTISEFSLPKKCSGRLHWAAGATYQDGTSASTATTTACP